MHLFDREKGSAKMGNLVPFVGMVMVILAQVSSMVITKAAMSSGVDKYVLIVYSNALSSLILLPCSFVFHRSLISWAFLNKFSYHFSWFFNFWFLNSEILQIGTSSMELLQPLYIDLSPFLDWVCNIFLLFQFQECNYYLDPINIHEKKRKKKTSRFFTSLTFLNADVSANYVDTQV